MNVEIFMGNKECLYLFSWLNGFPKLTAFNRFWRPGLKIIIIFFELLVREKERERERQGVILKYFYPATEQSVVPDIFLSSASATSEVSSV